MVDILKIERLRGGYGGSEIVRDIDLAVAAGEGVALVGPNGAGKSTFLKIVSGLLPAQSGAILVHGEDASRWTSAALVRSGLVHVPEGRQVFPGLSVDENLWLGGYAAPHRRKELREQVLEIFPKLGQRLKQAADTMSGGEQQMLAIGRGLMAAPRLLMIDEPTLGLAPVVVDSLIEALVTVRQRLGIALLMVEQNAMLAKEVCHLAYVMVGGKIVLKGQTESLTQEDLMKAYAGH